MSDVASTGGSAQPAASRHMVHLNLWALGDPLRREAQRRQLSVSDAIRAAVSQWLSQAVPDTSFTATVDAADAACDEARDATRVLLRLRPETASLLLQRASACGMSRSGFVTSLLSGASPHPLPTDHAPMIAALRASTDDVAALSTDLNAFLCVLGRAPAAELEPYRAALRSLIGRVDAHLEQAAALFAELDKTRRWR